MNLLFKSQGVELLDLETGSGNAHKQYVRDLWASNDKNYGRKFPFCRFL